MACDTCAALAPSRWNVAWLPSISTIEILTVIVQVAVFSPAVAVMVAVPSPMAVTIPSGDTVATASSEDVHVASPAPSGRTVAVTRSATGGKPITAIWPPALTRSGSKPPTTTTYGTPKKRHYASRSIRPFTRLGGLISYTSVSSHSSL